MPTLLDLAGVPIPGTVEGISLGSFRSAATGARREYLYGEQDAGDGDTRMMRDDRFKLIRIVSIRYYPVGNRVQLFDLTDDPDELHDLSDDATGSFRSAHTTVREQLTQAMIAEFHDGDENWVRDGKLVGLPDKTYQPGPDRGLLNQRGWRFM